jgi:hypothetical protein
MQELGSVSQITASKRKGRSLSAIEDNDLKKGHGLVLYVSCFALVQHYKTERGRLAPTRTTRTAPTRVNSTTGFFTFRLMSSERTKFVMSLRS